MVDVAQLAERWFVAPEVAGSSPVIHPLDIINAVTLPYGVIGNMTDSDSVVFGSSPDRAA